MEEGLESEVSVYFIFGRDVVIGFFIFCVFF